MSKLKKRGRQYEIHTLNKACGESGISEAMLDKAFEVWYPTLESELNELKEIDESPDSLIH